MAPLQKNSPKYLALQAQLERQIREGVLAHGSRLPSEEELCRQFGVSRGTVRAAFKGLTDEGLCTRRRGDGTYVSLRSHATGSAMTTATIYVVLHWASGPAMLHPFHESVLQGIQDELADRIQFRCIPLARTGSLEAFSEEFRDAAGIIASGGVPLGILESLVGFNNNVTTCQYRYPDLPASSATVDNVHAGRLVCTHLLRQGCRRILFVNIENSTTEFTERLAGAQQVFRESGTEECQFKVLHMDGEQGAAEQFDAQLESFQPDGIIACKDTLAIDLMGRLLEKRQRAFKSRLIGFDDLFIGSVLKPSLSTISQPAYQLGVQAAKLSLKAYHNGGREHYIMKPALVIRESTQESF